MVDRLRRGRLDLFPSTKVNKKNNNDLNPFLHFIWMMGCNKC